MRRLTLISLGAGVQSTTMALLAKHGDLRPMPDGAIFADTGEEPGAVYRHLEWLTPLLPFPVHVVRAWDGYGKPGIKGPLGEEIIKATQGNGKAGSHSRPPFFVQNPAHLNVSCYACSADYNVPPTTTVDRCRECGHKVGDRNVLVVEVPAGRGMIRRQCTGDYKIDPIHAKTRELLGLTRGQRWPKTEAVEQWVGISTDEASRMKPSLRPAIRSRWPLIDLGMSRRDCIAWLAAQGYPEPPKSACTFCPFHDDAAWRRLRDHDPEGWARAVEVDEAIRGGLTAKGLDGALFLHGSLVPLANVDLRTFEDRGQINMFENECAGVCGV